jgi:hypothetical protein
MDPSLNPRLEWLIRLLTQAVLTSWRRLVINGAHPHF